MTLTYQSMLLSSFSYPTKCVAALLVMRQIAFLASVIQALSSVMLPFQAQCFSVYCCLARLNHHEACPNSPFENFKDLCTLASGKMRVDFNFHTLQRELHFTS